MQEYHFKIQYDDFSAELAVGGDCSLHDFAKLIIKAVGFEFDHAFEFCDNLRDPYGSKERYTLFADMGEDDEDNHGVKTTPLSAVFVPRRKMLFYFDYGDDWFFPVTCTAIKESARKRAFKKILSTHGTPPEQYPDWEDE